MNTNESALTIGVELLSLNETISPDDHMLTAGNREAYFRTARSGLECILSGLQASEREPQSIASVLDFGCGYGRVYRAIAAAFPQASLGACDLMEAAARFCAETFGGEAIMSDESLSNTVLPHKYELIWLGSVFTHLPAHRWVSLLDFLANATERDAIVVMTTHGQTAIHQIENVVLKRNPTAIDSDRYARMKTVLPIIGFDFIPNKPGTVKNQHKIGIDVTIGEYGTSFVTPWWIEGLFARLPHWELVKHSAPGWARNHDAVTIRRR